MNRTNLLSAIVFTLVISGCSNTKNNTEKAFNNLTWMEGKWVSSDVTNYSEVWKKVNDTCFQGLSVSAAGSDSLVEERPQIVRRKDSIYFVNEVEEQTVEGMTQDFVLVSTSPDTLVFTNNSFNFPNRITYIKTNDTLMKVNVERKSAEGQIKFEYTLIKKK